jgi:hypothetical protein
MLPIAASLVAVMLAAIAGPAAAAEPPSRDEYRALIEPICEQNTIANERILKGAQRKANSGKMKEAGGQFIRASEKFAATTKEIAAVPRPTADDARLVKWFGFLETVAENLRKVGKALKVEDRVKAVHERIRVERSSNAANNVSYVFQFHYCRITPSRFT